MSKYDFTCRAATEILDDIRNNIIKPSELVDLYIKRILIVDKDLNAMAYDCFDGARKIAKEYDDMERSISSEMKLFGLPIIIKECWEYKGYPFTCGILKRKNIIGKKNSDIVDILLKNGVIILGAGNLSEGAMWIESTNPIYGTTNNPYDITRTSGGSSGGTAALISSVCCAMGITSDVGGSTRIPAFYCGIFGHKPTGGFVSNNGTIPKCVNKICNYCQIGPSSRYAKDLYPMLKIITKPEKKILLKNPKLINISKLNIVYLGDSFNNIFISNRDTELLNVEKNLLYFFKHKLKCNTSSKNIDLLKYSFLIVTTHLQKENEETFDKISGIEVPFNELLKNFFTSSVHSFPAIFLSFLDLYSTLPKFVENYILNKFNELRIEFENILDDNTIIISPTLPVCAPKHTETVNAIPNVVFTSIYNILELPVTAIPLGLNKDGIPLGVQIVAGRNNDHLCLAVAEKLNALGIAKWHEPKII